jgi:hypothetical protein
MNKVLPLHTPARLLTLILSSFEEEKKSRVCPPTWGGCFFLSPRKRSEVRVISSLLS